MKPVKVAQFGLGPIGLEALKHAAAQPWMEVVGAVDCDPAKSRRSLLELTGLGSLDGLSVSPTLDDLFRETQPDVILHTASSQAAITLQQMRVALELGLAVVSTCEELIYPALHSPALSREIEVLCQHTKSRLVATGVNPGFVMDLLPVFLSGVSRNVEHVRVDRIVNASTRRRSLQAKIGSGEDPEVVRTMLRNGQAGHAGLRESAALVGRSLGWNLDEIVLQAEPLLAKAEVRSEFFTVAVGQVCGIHQRAMGREDGIEKIALDLKMYLGAEDPHDLVVIRGQPDLNVTVNGGIAGDDATIGALINVVPRLLAAAPGFHLLTELAFPAWTGKTGHGVLRHV